MPLILTTRLHIPSIIVSAMVISLLCACSTSYWVKPGAGSDDWELDSSECRVLAAGAIPAATQQIQLSGGYRNPSVTNCSALGSNINCTTSGGDYVPPTYYAFDANTSIRDEAVELCLKRKGWRRVTEAELKAKSQQQQETRRDWCPEIDNFCDTKPYNQQASKSKPQRAKRDWCPEIDNFCP